MNGTTRTSVALALVVAVWSAIYLPGLGVLEIKGEEGRRILPAVSMLQTGNYLVPQIGSDAYFNKPPLVNWLVAASFKLFGRRNEWTARIPSALCVLAVALAFVVVARNALGRPGSLIAALVWLTNFGMIEKGRLIEIEALYASLTALAFICWMSWWQERRSIWLTWIVPWIFLGLALLAKGPLLLVFFYALVIAVLYKSGELRSIWNAAHVLGVVLMLGIFAAWAIPCLIMMSNGHVAHTWARQFSGRLSGEDFHLAGWLMNIPRGLGYFLPWTLLLPFVSNVERRTPNAERRTTEGGPAAPRRSTFDVRRSAFDVQSGLAAGIALSFFGVSLLPGSLARYTMPLLGPAAWLIATFLVSDSRPLPEKLRRRLPFIVAALAVLAIAIYAFALMPRLQQREKVRNIAAQINAALPPGAPLYAIDPDYQPALFYVRDPIVYLANARELPAAAHYILVQPAGERELAPGARTLLRLKDYRNKELLLLERGDGSP